MSRGAAPVEITPFGAAGVPSVLSRYRSELSAAAAYGTILLLLAVLRPEFFHKQFAGRWVDSSPVLIAAIGMTLVILARQIDISIGSQFSVCAVVAGLLAKAGMPMPLVAMATVMLGGAMGGVNGGFIAFMRLPSIVVTLATMVIGRETLRWLRQGQTVMELPARFQWFGASQVTGEWMLVAVALSVVTAFAWGMRWLAAGRVIYAVGSDQEAARLAGVRPQRVVFWVFVLMGALTGLAALLGAVRFPQVDPNSGDGLELQVIAAVVVGGCAISGGRGTLFGTLIGVALLATIAPALTFLNAYLSMFLAHPEQWEKAIQGAIILLAASSDGVLRRRR